MNIANNLKEINNHLSSTARLVAVSKFHPAEAIQEAYDAGQRIFGESRVQELETKHPILPKDIEWHFIGHLQKNKVKYIAPYVHLIHAVDSFKLLKEINKQAAKCNRNIRCLLQIHIAQEETKFGFSFDECKEMLKSEDLQNLSHISVAGLMAMATNTDDMAQVKSEFHSLKTFFDEVKTSFFADNDDFSELSMGMSNDYLVAVEEGSTLIRVGSKIFGQREY